MDCYKTKTQFIPPLINKAHPDGPNQHDNDDAALTHDLCFLFFVFLKAWESTDRK